MYFSIDTHTEKIKWMGNSNDIVKINQVQIFYEKIHLTRNCFEFSKQILFLKTYIQLNTMFCLFAECLYYEKESCQISKT